MRYSIQRCTEEAVVRAGGFDVKYADRLNIVFANLTEEQANTLKSQGAVVSEVKNVRTGISTPTPVIAPQAKYTASELVVNAGLDYLKRSQVPPLDGENVTIAVLDTGIRATHEMINNRVIFAKSFTGDAVDDVYNHGTGVASLIVTAAPMCNLINLKVLDDTGVGTEEYVVSAMNYIINLYDNNATHTPKIINLSLGSDDTNDRSNIMRVACRAVMDRNIIIVASGGNSGPSEQTITNPACETLVVAVGSCSGEPFEVSSFSSRGPTRSGTVKPDCVMLGEDVVLASCVSDTATKPNSGTSFSAPLVSGMLALYIDLLKRDLIKSTNAYPDKVSWFTGFYEGRVSPESVSELLARVGVKPQGESTSKDNLYGYGLPYGALVLQDTPTAGGTDISQLISAMIAMSMMTLAVGMMKNT